MLVYTCFPSISKSPWRFKATAPAFKRPKTAVRRYFFSSPQRREIARMSTVSCAWRMLAVTSSPYSLAMSPGDCLSPEV